MRKVLVVECVDTEATKMAEELGISEIACNVPRFEGYLKSLPYVVIESATNPGVILGAFSADKITKDELDILEDLPSLSVQPIRDLAVEIDQLRADIQAIKGG